jgi:predicted transcriptional regulator
LVINRRSEIEIISDILKLAYNGAKKTEILYQGNFSYSQLNSYLSFLISMEIIEENEINDNGITSKSYKTTDKGLILLKDAEKLLSHFDL